MRSPTPFIVALAVLAAACAGRADREAPFEETPETWVEVDNRTTLDATIYVMRDGGHRQRLGTATAVSTTRLRIPERTLFGLTSLRFQADPIGSRAEPISQTITVRPGEVVTLILSGF